MRRVVAIGVDAAEWTLIQQLFDAGELPRLKEIHQRGVSARVTSPADIGSGAVWPTFMTGESPLVHGVYSHFDWLAAQMSFSPVSVSHIEPFWRRLAVQGYRVGVLDVPFAPPVDGLKAQVLEWAPHDLVLRRTIVSPVPLQKLVAVSGGVHPFARPPMGDWTRADERGLARLISACIEGIRRRSELALALLREVPLDLLIAVFSEVHRASHVLWHTVEPEQLETQSRSPSSSTVKDGLRAIYRSLDRELGRLIDFLEEEDRLVLFSLHGMRRSNGVVSLLEPLFRARGIASTAALRSSSWSDRKGALISAARQKAPRALKSLVYQVLDPATVLRATGGSPAVPNYDWGRTTAFPMPTDQHGWIRLNVAGREAQGIVPGDRYGQVSEELKRVLRGLETKTGQPIVRDVLQPGSRGSGPPHRLPDLVVHWRDEALTSRMSLSSPPISVRLEKANLTGQHAPDGFCMIGGSSAVSARLEPVILAEDLHKVILRLLES